MTLDWLNRDGKLLFTARILRAFAYGFLSIILAIYLKSIGFSEILVGILLSVTLVNSVIFTLFASFYADRIGRRKILMIYAALMALSGFIFVLTSNYLALIAAALIGTINVTGTETGSFLSIEQAILPQTVSDIRKRNMAFALYNTVGTLAMASGILMSGLPQILQVQFAIIQSDSFKFLFLSYSALALATLALYTLLTNSIETQETIPKPVKKILSPSSRKIVGKLSGLFAVDSFAGGFVIQSFVSFWFFTKFGIDLATISYIFSIAGALTAFSFLAAAKIADRIGLINTMVFTHIPSNILLMLVPIAPSLPFAIAFYLARMAISQMDVPARQAYIVAVVSEGERTSAAGITNLSRNIAQSVSPSLTGALIQILSSLSAPFLIGGGLKIAYDLAVYFNFRRVKLANE
jgi:MFS family permease